MIKILEIGCGQGFNSNRLSKLNNVKVIGVDFSEKDIAIAKERYPHIDFKIMNVENLEFENQYFDQIYAMDILEHVDNLEKVIRECTRVLKKDGKFVINVPAEKSEKWLLKIRPTYFEEIHHVRIFKNTQNELENILSKFNFKIIKKKKTGFLQHIELYFLFTQTKKTETQLGIGNWRDSKLSMLVHVGVLYFGPVVFLTPLKWIPIWIITLPIGTFVSFFGNTVFPKSFYYEFVKTE